MSAEIFMVPFFGQGHLFPCSELCKLLFSKNYRITLIIPSSLSSSISTSLLHHPLIQVAELSLPPPSPEVSSFHDHHHHQSNMASPLSDLLSGISNGPESPIPVCAIVDVMMSWALETFQKFKIPTVSFFTSGACSAAMEYALWKLHLENLKPGETCTLPGLPEDMRLTFADLTHKDPPPPPSPSHHHGDGPPSGGSARPPPGPPPTPGHKPPWVSETEGSIALMINTSDNLERPFLDYLANQIRKPVWGVGPLLPERYWQSSSDSLVHDHDVRSKRETNVSEDEVSQWLDMKPRGSVVYVSFGTEVGPTVDELAELADALAESNRSFIWVLQSSSGRPGPPGRPPGPPSFHRPNPLESPEGPPGPPGLRDPIGAGDFFPHELVNRAEGRGLIIRGWAPQLLILSHPSTGGFVSHCGWNSVVEAIGRGVPLLIWPIRGDQHYNAKLVVSHLKVGSLIQEGDRTESVKKDDILRGIEKLMVDDATRNRATSLRAVFDHGFPASSMASLDAFRDFIDQICQQS